jgi:hypothetical protein
VFSKSYHSPMLHAFITQVILYGIASCALDFGLLRETCFVASVLFWIGVAALIWWNPQKPARFALEFIRWGVIPVFLAVVPLLLPVVGHYFKK